MRSRIIIVVIALLLGGAAAVAAATYLNGAKARLDAQTKPVEVLVAKQNIAKGTTASELFEKKLVEVQEVPAQYVASDALSSERAIEGQVLAVDLTSGEQLTAGRFKYPNQAGLAYNIPDTYVALSVPVDKVSGVAGLVKPGDNVAILSTVEEADASGNATTTTRIIIPRARVLAVASDSGAGTTTTTSSSPGVLGGGSTTSGDQAAGTVTLALSPTDAEKVAFSVNEGSGRGIWLALLPTSTSTDIPATSGQTAITVLR